jgi:hypothetical protein
MPSRRRRVFVRLAQIAGLVLIAAQFVPVNRANPSVESVVPAPPPVHDILRRACFDCHSNETVWPWYSRVAPVSWLVARDVHQGREHLNFSTWNRLDPSQRVKALEEAWEEIEAGDMPMAIYVPLHPDARLTDGDKTALQAWIREATRP